MDRKTFTLVANIIAAMTGTVAVAETPNIAVIGNDALSGTVPCGNRIFETVQSTLADQLTAQGFQVFAGDTRAVATTADGGCGHDTETIVELVQAMKSPPMDISIIYRIFPSRERQHSVQWLSARLNAEIIDVATGQALGNAEVTSHRPEALVAGCVGDCVLETASRHVRPLANDLATILAMKLQTWVPPETDGPSERVAGFNVAFTNFDADDITGAEEYLAAFRGYQTHRVVDCTISRCEYWYETTSDASRLNRNLRLMLDHLGLQGQVTQSNQGFIINKITSLQ